MLVALEAEWRRQGAPIVDELAPGTDDDRISHLMAPLGISLPEELRVWWKWHDGLVGLPIDYDFGRGFERAAMGPGVWCPISLADAVAYYGRQPRYPGPQHPEDPSWQASWFPFAKFGLNQDVLFVDTARGPRPPVQAWWIFDSHDWDLDQAPSLTDAVRIWLRVLTEGYFTWDSEARAWRDRVAYLPPDLRSSLTT